MRLPGDAGEDRRLELGAAEVLLGAGFERRAVAALGGEGCRAGRGWRAGRRRRPGPGRAAWRRGGGRRGRGRGPTGRAIRRGLPSGRRKPARPARCRPCRAGGSAAGRPGRRNPQPDLALLAAVGVGGAAATGWPRRRRSSRSAASPAVHQALRKAGFAGAAIAHQQHLGVGVGDLRLGRRRRRGLGERGAAPRAAGRRSGGRVRRRITPLAAAEKICRPSAPKATLHHPVGMASENLLAAAALEVPHPHRGVGRAGNETSAIGAEGHARDPRAVPFENPQAMAGFSSPTGPGCGRPSRSGSGARRGCSAIGFDAGEMAFELEQAVAVLEAPTSAPSCRRRPTAAGCRRR